MNRHKKNKIVILGGGLIGLSTAYEFAKNKFEVEVLSKKRSEAAGFVAAGMLAAHAEGLQDELLTFGQLSQKMMPEWIKNIESDSGINCDLHKCGIVVPFQNYDDLQKFPTLKYGHYLDNNELKQEISGLNTIWKHGLLFKQDGQIDNRRRLMRALEKACATHGVKFREGANVKKLIFKNETLKGIFIQNATGDSETILCEKAILCSGAWSKNLLKELPIFPVKGQMLSIQGPSNRLKRILFGEKIYLVPRNDGLIIVGATVEKQSGFDNGNTPKGIKKLQHGIDLLFPEASKWPHMEHWWGFRPSTPDLKPIIGESPIKNLYLATGHYRNGVLFSAVTSNLIYKLILNESLEDIEKDLLTKFHLRRFKTDYSILH